MAAYESPTTHGTVKPAGVPVFWFSTSTCFRFWSKTFTKRCSNNFLLSRDKSIFYYYVINQFLPCMFWKNNCFRFWWKTYTNRCTSNYIKSGVKLFSSPALCIWSGAFNFRVWFRKWNMVVKIPILILFFFCLLCWLKNLLFCVLSVVSASFFNYVGPCRWFYLALDGFSSF